MKTDVAITQKVPSSRWIRIIPPIFLVYVSAFMDRVNISFAITGGMDKSLSMTADISGLAAGIFFVGYMVLQVRGGRAAERGSAKRFIALSILAWSIIAFLSGFVQNIPQLLVARFFLGVAEGGIAPSIYTIISHWFPNEERGRANALALLNIPVASILTGPLSGWIITLYGWRSVFIVEGIISFALIALWLPLISDRPENAKWISKEEKEYIASKLKEEQADFGGSTNEKIPIGKVLSNRKVWHLVLIYFCYQTGLYGFSLWLPTLLKSLVHGSMEEVGMLSALPYIGTIIGFLVFASLSDKSKNRKLYTALIIVGLALCLMLSTLTSSNKWVSFAFLCGCGLFYQTASSIFWTIPPILFPPDMAATSRGIINALGNLGGFLGPYIVGFLTYKYNSNVGIYSLVIFLILGFILALALPKTTEGKQGTDF